MTPDLFLALFTFAFVGTMTPGPNNLMLMASGANFGFQRTIPHMLGIGIGFSTMVFLVGLGLSQVFVAYPMLNTILKVLSVGYFIWLAWKIANASAPGSAEVEGKPLTFLQAAGFQWVNPKAWAMALGAASLFLDGAELVGALWLGGTYALVSCASTTSWTALGQQLRRFLTNPRRLTVFNFTMAGLLVLSLYPVLNH